MVADQVPGSRMRSRGMPAIVEGDETNPEDAPNLDGDTARTQEADVLKTEAENEALPESGDAGNDAGVERPETERGD